MAEHAPLLLYSVNTYLAYKIGQDFYGDRHFCWCAPAFDTETLAALGFATPSTSCPDQIHDTYERHVRSEDRHSEVIRANRLGIRRGAAAQCEGGMITQAQKEDIGHIVRRATFGDFRPVIYIIPYVTAKPHVDLVSTIERAHPLASKYRTASLLHRHLFDIISFSRKSP